MFRFEKLEVYERAITFSDKVYNLSKKWPRQHLYGLTDQLRRAALSIALNIAEGSGRTPNEFKRFLDIARGSCYECVPLIDIAFRQGLILKDLKEELYEEITIISKMLVGLKKSIK